MADRPIRVLFRFVYGQPHRHAWTEVKKAASKSFDEHMSKWKAAGVRLLSSWRGTGGNLDGYCHYWILEMKDLEQLSQFNMEFDQSEAARYVDEYSLIVGDIEQPWDGYWALR
jgi:hypothetical protein